MSGGSGVSHSAQRLPQEVGGAPGGVGPALTQLGHQHLAGAGGDGQQRVIAPLAGVAVATGALVAQSVGLADGGIEINGQRAVAGPPPAAHARANNSRLTRSSWRTWPHRKLCRKAPRVEGALTT